MVHVLEQAAAFAFGLLRRDDAGGQHLHNGGHAAGASLFHAADELVHDGFHYARARGHGGVGIHFDLNGIRLGGGLIEHRPFSRDDRAGKSLGDDDRGRGLVIVN